MGAFLLIFIIQIEKGGNTNDKKDVNLHYLTDKSYLLRPIAQTLQGG